LEEYAGWFIILYGSQKSFSFAEKPVKMTIQKIRVWAPLFFWCFQLFINLTRNIYLIPSGLFWNTFSRGFITYPLDIITFCVFYYYFAPQFFKKTELKLNIFLSILYAFLYGSIWLLVYYFFQIKDYSSLRAVYFSSFGHTLNYSFMGVLIRLALDWFDRRESSKELEKQNIKTELALLRAQINPHFLFNTLNNINSFATQNSEKTSYAIIKLSEIMRYMLYEANGERVLLDKEIQYIRNFLELHKLRYKNNSFIKFTVTGNTANIFISPMLFIPFIENAFKHGIKSIADPIIIEIMAENEEIYFTCSNTKRQLSESEKQQSHGIGIQNIKRRLDYLYSGRYTLMIDEEGKTFSVYLKVRYHEN